MRYCRRFSRFATIDEVGEELLDVGEDDVDESSFAVDEVLTTLANGDGDGRGLEVLDEVLRDSHDSGTGVLPISGASTDLIVDEGSEVVALMMLSLLVFQVVGGLLVLLAWSIVVGEFDGLSLGVGAGTVVGDLDGDDEVLVEGELVGDRLGEVHGYWEGVGVGGSEGGSLVDSM